jgi:hypothetical protein
MTPEDAKLLRATLRRAPPRALKRLFALIRAHDDRALLAALAPARAPARRPRDPLAAELEQTLRPILAPAREKADLLVDHLARGRRRKLALSPTGLADAARQLRAHFSDAQISAAAKSLVERLARQHGGGEGVV